MRGCPKYKVGDYVSLTLDGKKYEGTIYIVDKFGAWSLIDNNGEPSYDIMMSNYEYDVTVKDFNTGETHIEHRKDSECLVKHIREICINGKKKKRRISKSTD